MRERCTPRAGAASAGARLPGGRRALTLDELQARVGQELGCSSWLRIDQAAIRGLADLTHEWQDIHVDATAARASGFGGTIAHGFLTLSLLSAMAEEVVPRVEGLRRSVNYGLDHLRFLAPVRCGDRVRGRFTLEQAGLRAPGQYQLKHSVVVQIEQRDRPALVAQWLVLLVAADAEPGARLAQTRAAAGEAP